MKSYQVKIGGSNVDYELILSALETLPNLIIVDKTGKIVYLNKKYARLLGVSTEDVVGKQVSDVILNTRMEKIIQTGKDEIGSFMTLMDHRINEEVTLVCNRLLIREKDEICGAVAMTTLNNLSEVEALEVAYRNIIEENQKMKEELNHLREAINPIEKIIGVSKSAKRVKQEIMNYAKSNLPILITGETGVGKEVVAEAIHAVSNRVLNNYVKINCAAIPSDLLESELFGYEEGAFSGAKKGGKIGKFELANNGTLLLDEIGDMPINLQVKLLRVLQEGVIDRIGSVESIPVNVRLICSTNSDLQKKVEEKEFREDLYYRINVVEISVPPLRARTEDIPILIDHFIKQVNQEEMLNIQGIDISALAILNQYNWKGNIRELKHVIQRAAVHKRNGVFEITDFEFIKKKILGQSIKIDNDSLKGKIIDVEKDMIIEALDLFNGNKSKAAKHLNMDRSMLYKKIKKYNIN